MTIDLERAQRAIDALRKPDASLQRVPNTIRQSIAEVIEDLVAGHHSISEHSAAADVLERVAAANCADPANDDLTVHLAIKLAEAEQKNIDWGNLQRVREDVRADVLLAEAIAAERERCARIAEHDDRQMEWPRLEQDGRRMAPTARMQQAIATAIRRALVSGSTEGGNG